MTNRYVKMVNGVEIPMTPEEIAERQAEENAPPPPLPLNVRLDGIFNGLPVEIRAQFYYLKPAIKLAIEQGDTEAAEAIIANAPVPSELEAVRQSLLAQFA